VASTRQFSGTTTNGTGSAVQGARKVTPTLVAYLDRWLSLCEGRALRPATIASYRATIELHIVPGLGSQRLDQISPTVLNELYLELLRDGRKSGGGLSTRTVRYAHSIVRKALGDAVRLGYIVSNPALASDPPSAASARSRVAKTWTPDELGLFLRATTAHPLHEAFFLAATTGLRRGEVLGLRWCDIDFEGSQFQVVQTVIEVSHVITVSVPKTERSRRVVALDRRTLALLATLRANCPSPEDGQRLLFATAQGSPLHPACFSYAFKRAVAKTGLPAIRFHDLRHTHATMALRAGVHPKIVSERLGHSTVSMTLDVYSHAVPSMQREAAEAIAALIPP
jgi:integrase